MKQSLTGTFMFMLFLSTHAFAALGNNENEVENLFGAPLRKFGPDKRGIATNHYEKGNYVILVQFLDHLSLAESYHRADQRELSQKEIDAFLEGSSNGRTWSKDPSTQAWERADHKAKAWIATVRNCPTLLIQAR